MLTSTIRIRWRMVRIVLATMSLAACVTSFGLNQDSDRMIAITNLNVVTMLGDEILRNHTVLLDGDRILTIGPTATFGVPDGATVLDGGGGYLIPGLWDMHVHIFGPTMETEVFPALLTHGITGVRDMNGAVSLDSIQRLKANIRIGSVVGPTIVAPGPLIDAPGRSPDELSAAIREIGDPEEARSTVRELAEQGADFIKVYNRLTGPLLDALFKEANAVGIPVAGHIPLPMEPSRLSRAGMVSQEHLQGILEESSTAGDEFREFIATAFEGTPDRETIDRFVELRTRMVTEFDAERASQLFEILASVGTAITPTLVSNRGVLLAGIDESLTSDSRWAELPDDIRASWSQPSRLYSLFDAELKSRWYDQLLSIVEQMDAQGVPLLAGTDLGVPWVYAGSSLHDELELLVQAGLSPRRALAAATSTPAHVLGLDDHGTIEAGNIADLVLLGSNPFEDITAVRDIRAVILRGRILDDTGTKAPGI